jgi:hypothetical protein
VSIAKSDKIPTLVRVMRGRAVSGRRLQGVESNDHRASGTTREYTQKSPFPHVEESGLKRVDQTDAFD